MVFEYLEGGIVAKPLTKAGFYLQWYVVHLKTDSLPVYYEEFIKHFNADVDALLNESGESLALGH